MLYGSEGGRDVRVWQQYGKLTLRNVLILRQWHHCGGSWHVGCHCVRAIVILLGGVLCMEETPQHSHVFW